MAMSETKRISILVVAISFLFLAQADMRFDFPSFNESIMEDFVTEEDASVKKKDKFVMTEILLLSDKRYINYHPYYGCQR